MNWWFSSGGLVEMNENEKIGDKTPSALDVQVGGSHYKTLAIQPAEYCFRNKLGGLELAVIKYVTRWRQKNGVEDLKKARHTLDLMIELHEKFEGEGK
jgi:hypothetical protein